MSQTQPNPAILPLVRAKVQDLLTHSQAYQSLDPVKRRDLARDMVHIANYIVGGSDGQSIPGAFTLADDRPPDPAGQTATGRLVESGGTAAALGVEQFGEAINKIDFPKFVAGLIDGVFNAIVSSSIKQMEAYAELVKNVAKSVDEFMRENVSENQARDYLADRYPDALELDLEGEAPKLKPREGVDDSALPDFFADLGLPAPIDSLDEETTETVLVPAARKRMAMDRQQLLATMVLMGINRLVVTNGTIKASVLFELDTLDKVTRHYDRASTYDWTNTTKQRRRGSGKSFWDWFSPSTTESETTSNFKVSTTRSEDSQAKIDLHAKLSGDVNVNFRSETFPLERMADILQVNEIQKKAPNYTTTQPRTAAPGAPAAPAPAGSAPAR
jgi:hypothetical protein